MVIIALVLISFLFVGCSSGVTERAPQEKAEPIKIAWIGPLTGAVASLGIDNLHGVRLAVTVINEQGGIEGRPLQLIVEDDQLDPKLTVSAYQKAKLQGANAILSPSYSGLLSVVNDADATKTVLINSLDTSEEIASAGEYLFAVGIYDEGIGYRLAEFIHNNLNGRTVAIIYNNEDAFMSLVKNAFADRFVSLGGRVTLSAEYSYDTTDFRTILLKARQAGADALVVLGYDEAGFILKQARELGINITILGTDTFTSKNFLANAGSAAEGIYITSWDASTPDYAGFLEQFKAAYGTAPDQPLFSAAGYDAVMVLAQAMRQGGVSGKELHDTLYLIENTQGITGVLTMSPDGVVRTVREDVFQLQDGKPVAVN